jgi:plasmid stabilization system protein ParE
MTYRVELTARARRDLELLYRAIDAANSELARVWFNGLEAAVLSLDEHPARCPVTPEDPALRHLLYGRKGRVYRIVYMIDEPRRVVSVLHIRHGSRQPLLRRVRPGGESAPRPGRRGTRTAG